MKRININGKSFGYYLIPVLIVCGLLFFSFVTEKWGKRGNISQNAPAQEIGPSPAPIPSPTPTPRPLTFEEMQRLYGACVTAPTLIYHHVQDIKVAQKNGQTSLTVDPVNFRQQMQYLKEKGYTAITMQDLVRFFNDGAAIGGKPVLITFDDGYEDFYTNAYPVLKEFSFGATVFLPTGLAENPGYLTWRQIEEMSAGGNIYFANHTWSHQGAATDKETIEEEISRADIQLAERGLNQVKVFAYPYGASGAVAENYLKSLNYNLAFTTRHGKILCQNQRFSLPRLHIGNVDLSWYGL